MREIKFRGKFLDDSSEWLYGNYVFLKDDTFSHKISDNNGLLLDIDEKTLGQYTGLKDKNGVEIYEGDIVTKRSYPFIDEGKQNYVGIVYWYKDTASFGYDYKLVNKAKRGISDGINNEFKSNKDLICDDLEVIGNIWDNEDLLNDN